MRRGAALALAPRRPPALAPSTPRRPPALAPSTPRRPPALARSTPRRPPALAPSTPRRPPALAPSTPRASLVAIVAVALVALALAACSSSSPTPPPSPAAAPSTTATTTAPAVAPTSTPVAPAVVEIAYRLENRAAIAGFEDVVEATLHDPRGWEQARFRFVRLLGPAAETAPFRIVLVEPDEAQELCRPYDVYRKYSCQIGPLVVLNAERWRHATPQWTGDLASYRQMLVNHEVGHLLGMHHPPHPCPVRGRAAEVMAQQSTELRGCLPNPWPLPHEIERAARHDLPLAPPFERP